MNKEELVKQIENFKVFKKRKWKSWKTKRNNEYYFALFVDFLGEKTLERDTLVAFFNSMEDKLAESVRRQAETALMAFTRWLHEEGITPKNFGKGIARTEVRRQPHMLPTSSKVAGFIRQVGIPTLRDNKLTTFSKLEHMWCLLFIVFACGGRNHETSMIGRKDVSISSREIEIVYGKNGPRIIGIPEIPWLIKEIERRVRGRNEKELEVLSDRTHFKEEYIERLFVVNEKKLEETMRKVGELFGRPMCVHDLRRIFARDMKANGADIDDIRIAMGHKNIETTLGYLYDDPSDIKRVLNEYNSEARRFHTKEQKFKRLVDMALGIGVDIKSSLDGEVFEIKGRIIRSV